MSEKKTALDRLVALEEAQIRNLINAEWTLGFYDRGMGHGSFAVMNGSAVVVKCPNREVAEHIINGHNRLQAVKCPSCGGPTTNLVADHDFEYGAKPLTCRVHAFTCVDEEGCGAGFTDWTAEDAREAAVQAHLDQEEQQ